MNIVNENLFEFKKGLDPIDSLGLGRRAMIEEWFEKLQQYNRYRPEIKYKILDDLSINLYSDLFINDEWQDCAFTKSGELPEFINFNTFKSNLIIEHTNITTLRGLPKYVTGYITISNNRKLTSLKYIPKLIGDRDSLNGYMLDDNDLVSLKGLPKFINGSLYAGFNPNLTLDGLPKKIIGNLELPIKLKKDYEKIISMCEVGGFIAFDGQHVDH